MGGHYFLSFRGTLGRVFRLHVLFCQERTSRQVGREPLQERRDGNSDSRRGRGRGAGTHHYSHNRTRSRTHSEIRTTTTTTKFVLGGRRTRVRHRGNSC